MRIKPRSVEEKVSAVLKNARQRVKQKTTTTTERKKKNKAADYGKCKVSRGGTKRGLKMLEEM